MEIPKKIYFKLRPLILPIKEIINHIPLKANILDLGCGKGILLEHIKNYNSYIGIDLKAPKQKYDVKVNFKQLDCIEFIENNLDEFNTFLIIDLLHHIPKNKQNSFVDKLCTKLKKGDRIIIKDINPQNTLTRYWNLFHDLLFARQIINYFDFKIFEKSINHEIRIISKFHKRILFYDHYFLVLEKN